MVVMNILACPLVLQLILQLVDLMMGRGLRRCPPDHLLVTYGDTVLFSSVSRQLLSDNGYRGGIQGLVHQGQGPGAGLRALLPGAGDAKQRRVAELASAGLPTARRNAEVLAAGNVGGRQAEDR